MSELELVAKLLIRVVFSVVCGCEGKGGSAPKPPKVFRIGGKLRGDQPGWERKVPGKLGTSRGLPGGLISQLASSGRSGCASAEPYPARA
jgi:hypothetical protein